MPKEIIRKMTLGEISAVDRPAQAPALKAIIKAHNLVKKDKMIGKSVKLTTVHDDHQHAVDTIGWDDEYLQGGRTSWSADTNGEDGHDHPWVRNENGGVVIGMALGHKHGIADVNKTATGTINGEKLMASKLTKSLLATAALTAMAIQKFDDTADWGVDEAADIIKAAGEQGIAGLIPEGGDFAKAKAAADNSDDDEEAGKKKKFTDMEDKLNKMSAIADLTTVEKSHYDTLDEDAAAAFLKSDSKSKETLIEKASGDNPVTFTSMDGTEFRKNDDQRMVKMARDLDAKTRDLAKAAVAQRDSDIEKMSSEYSNLPGSSDVKKGMFGAIADIENEEVRNGAYAIFKAADSALGGDFAPTGAISKSDAKGAEDKLDTMAKAHAKDNNVSFAKAYREVTKTDDGRALYNQMRLGELAQ